MCTGRASQPFGMNRNDLQILADARVADAEALLTAGRWAGAYYLVGSAVECALKACISAHFREHDVPEKRSGAYENKSSW